MGKAGTVSRHPFPSPREHSWPQGLNVRQGTQADSTAELHQPLCHQKALPLPQPPSQSTH
jgi:hypothetical protein